MQLLFTSIDPDDFRSFEVAEINEIIRAGSELKSVRTEQEKKTT